MWINKKQWKKEKAEVVEIHRSLAQAMNRQFPPETPDQYVRGWNAALIEVHLALRATRQPIHRGRSRQSTVTHRTDRPEKTGITAS